MFEDLGATHRVGGVHQVLREGLAPVGDGVAPIAPGALRNGGERGGAEEGCGGALGGPHPPAEGAHCPRNIRRAWLAL